jgi:energy-coupling factor transporter transmembrane protein EcfT
MFFVLELSVLVFTVLVFTVFVFAVLVLAVLVFAVLVLAVLVLAVLVLAVLVLVLVLAMLVLVLVRFVLVLGSFVFAGEILTDLVTSRLTYDSRRSRLDRGFLASCEGLSNGRSDGSSSKNECNGMLDLNHVEYKNMEWS